jgi:hypothetical protein
MNADAYKVALVVDKDFGEKLLELASRLHVWVCSTPQNRKLAAVFWAEQAAHSLECGLTTFKVDDGHSPEEMCVNIIGTIDLHHGEFSHNPAWSVLEVYGAQHTPKVEEAFKKYGAKRFEKTSGGFFCYRD